jgi:hypothetical protein
MFRVESWTDDLMEKVKEQKQRVNDYVDVLSTHSQCLNLLILRIQKLIDS